MVLRGSEAQEQALEHPEASREELQEALIQRIKGPDFPTGAQILGVKGINDAYRTGRGSITMRAVVNVEGSRARDGSNNASGRSVTFPDGRNVFTATSEGGR